jgi:hypothetical protein
MNLGGLMITSIVLVFSVIQSYGAVAP